MNLLPVLMLLTLLASPSVVLWLLGDADQSDR